MYYTDAEVSLAEIGARLAAFRPNPDYPHDPYVLIAIQEAVLGAREGNFGVGACLVDGEGNVLVRAHNQMFQPYFRSDLHAEMNLMTRFEDAFRNYGSSRELTLYTSLESCPMCVVREITAGLGHVYHAAPDIESGMACTLERLTPVWVELAKRTEFAEAACSAELKELALQVWLVTANANQARVAER
jgi:tRNA(adenine34) deaminase